MNRFDKTDIGKTFKQWSGYEVTLIGSFKKDGEIIFVGKSTRPSGTFELYWDNGNTYRYSDKDDYSNNYNIRK